MENSQPPELLTVEDGPFPTKSQGREGFHWAGVNTGHVDPFFGLELSFREMRSHSWSSDCEGTACLMEPTGASSALCGRVLRPPAASTNHPKAGWVPLPRRPQPQQPRSEQPRLFLLTSQSNSKDVWSFTSSLLCAWEVKQLSDPSFFSWVNKRKDWISRSSEKHLLRRKACQIYGHLSYKTPPWAKSQGCQIKRKKANSVDTTASLPLQVGEVRVTAEWFVFL